MSEVSVKWLPVCSNKEELSMRNRATSVLLAVVCLAICLSACASGPRIPVVSVSEILGIGPIGMYNRYAGVIEAGETVSPSICSDAAFSPLTE